MVKNIIDYGLLLHQCRIVHARIDATNNFDTPNIEIQAQKKSQKCIT